LNCEKQIKGLVMQKNSFYLVISLVLLAVLFASLSLLSGRYIRGMRIDLSENQLYTLSEGTQNILSGLDEPVNLYLFFSEEASRDLPQIRSYAQRVDELLDELAARSDGKLLIHRVDPEPFSEQEDEAAQFGLQAVPVGAGGASLYLGIAGTNSIDELQTMPFLQPAKEKFLEYDLAKMVSSLGNPKRKIIGLLSSLPMSSGYDPTTQSMREAWVIYEQLSQTFDLQNIEAGATELPDELDLLVLVHPRELSPEILYQLDQFVLTGGRLLVFIDPLAESDRGNPADPMGQMQAGGSSELAPLLGHWGVQFDSQKTLGDMQYGAGNGRTRHIGILSVPTEGMNGDDIVSADLEVVNFSSTGWLQPKEGGTTQLDVLVESSENAAPIDAARLRFLSNPADLMTGFNPTGNRYALAMRISGQTTSAFEPAPEVAAGSAHQSASDENGINVVVFADTDILTDRLWAQKQPFLGQNLVTSFADNGNIVVNSVDNLLGDKDLISIRTRASSVRPFDRVNELQLQAEREYRATEERLQLELSETERKLTEIQAARGEDDLLVLTDEQQAEIQRFMDRKIEIRRDLRQVQHDLQRDIGDLGTRLKLFNIVLVPLVVMAFALIYGLRRRQRQFRQAGPE
jgi:ABC-type uncharacterized transport system involved in gliding motility auxiliary subunit